MFYNRKMGISLKPLFRPEEIGEAVKRLACELNRDFEGKRPVLLILLNGAFIFGADLVRELDIESDIVFISASSYGMRTSSSGKVRLGQAFNLDIKGRDLIIVEDIIDTGNTCHKLLEYLDNLGADSISVCTLLLREGAPVRPEYAGFTIGRGFVVGYGLDYKEDFRGLKSIFVAEESS